MKMLEDPLGNFTELTKRIVMKLAFQEASQLNHGHISCGHILLAILKEGGGMAYEVLSNLGVTLNTAREEMTKTSKKDDPGPATMGKRSLTPSAKHMIEIAMMAARNMDLAHIHTEHLLLGMLEEYKTSKNTGGKVLIACGLNLEDVKNKVLELSSNKSPLEKPGTKATAPPKCKIFAFCSTQTKTEELTEKIGKRITKFFSDGKKEIRKMAQSSAADPLTNQIHTYITVFYQEKE